METKAHEQMILKDSEGNILEFVYWSHDRWLEYLDYFMINEFIFKVNTDSTWDLIDRVSAHYSYWLNDYLNSEDNSSEIKARL